MHVESVYHSSDPRIRKDGNRVSEGAIAQGCWEFAPEGHSPEMAKAIQLIVDFEKKLQEALTSIASLQKEVKDLQAKPQASKSK